MMVTNAILGGIADTVAQSITAIRQRSARKQQDATTFEIHELDRKNPPSERDVMATESRALASPFDFERLTRFMTYGFAMAPLQFRWFSFLDKIFPITKTAAFSPAMKRVALDQIVFAPFGIAVFFSAMTLAEGGGRRGVAQKMRDMYVPTLKANYMVWPLVQIINFRLMPVQFQLVRFLNPWATSLPALDANGPALAFCFDRRHCLDRLPLPHKRHRRCRAGRSSQLATSRTACLEIDMHERRCGNKLLVRLLEASAFCFKLGIFPVCSVVCLSYPPLALLLHNCEHMYLHVCQCAWS